MSVLIYSCAIINYKYRKGKQPVLSFTRQMLYYLISFLQSFHNMKPDRQEELLERIALVKFIKHHEPRFRNCFLGGFTMEELLQLESEIKQKLSKKNLRQAGQKQPIK